METQRLKNIAIVILLLLNACLLLLLGYQHFQSRWAQADAREELRSLYAARNLLDGGGRAGAALRLDLGAGVAERLAELPEKPGDVLTSTSSPGGPRRTPGRSCAASTRPTS